MFCAFVLTVPLALSALAGDQSTESIVTPPPTSPTSSHVLTSSGLSLVPATLDLGRVAAGKTVSSAVWLVNTATTPITIDSAKAGCGCTTLAFEPTTIAPGEAARVPFTLNAPDKAGTNKSARITFQPEWGAAETMTVSLETISLQTTTPESATVTIIEPAPADALLFVPNRADLGIITGGTPIETSAWLINTGSTSTQIDRISAGCGCTKVIGFTPTTLAAGHAVRVRLQIEAKPKVNPEKIVTLTAHCATTLPLQTRVQMSVTLPAGQQLSKASRTD